MNKLKTFGALLILAANIVSCDNDDFNTPARKVIADVFVRCKITGNDTVYAPVFYTYSNFSMKTVKVDGPTNSNIELDLKMLNKGVFRSVPVNSNFSTKDVVNGIYQFDITAEDKQTYTISDKLLSSRLDPLKITDFEYDNSTHSIKVNWDDVDDADTYVVKIHDKIDGELIYSSERIKSTKHNVTYNPNSNSWTKFKTIAGKTYVVGVYAYKFELSNAQSGYDINCESVAYREIKW